MNKTVFILGLILWSISIQAVDLDTANRDPEYVKTIVERSRKIVDKLNLKEDVAAQVNNIVSNRYFKLNDIYEKRDSLVTKIKASDMPKEVKEKEIKAIQDEKEAALYRSHFAFPTDLSLFLNDSQIEEIKDGITYGVVMVTYNSTLDMIPSLTEEEKAQILAWLKEAREFAIDAESSNKKHEAFGKYKGRINNYLAKRGYDLTKERQEWYKRIESRKK